ncbi:methyltransferase [Micromonospora sediminicola]|uniref:methyltransferase n=1 Tax=Micromonospora sediminicola TaxID=946078 RepID=UPI003404908A
MLGDDDKDAKLLWAMANLGAPMAIRVAATLRIADHIAAGHHTASDLANIVNADPDALHRLLCYLAKRKVLACDSLGRFTLTDLGRVLRENHPSRLRSGLDIDGIGRAELAYVHLLHSVRTGAAAYPVQYGRSFWDDLAESPTLAQAFNELMGNDAPKRAAATAAAYDWASLGHLIDIGGGDGSTLVTLLQAHPTLKGTVLERASVAQSARDTIRSAGVSDRCTVVEGSFFDPLPRGAGGYLLSWILHDWDDCHAQLILRRCAEAAPVHGRVLVVEKTGSAGDQTHTGLDLRMLVYYGGKERTISELSQLSHAADLRVAAVHPAGALSVVELVKKGG